MTPNWALDVIRLYGWVVLTRWGCRLTLWAVDETDRGAGDRRIQWFVRLSVAWWMGRLVGLC